MYACFLLKSSGWKFETIVSGALSRDLFIKDAQEMMGSRLLGARVLGYDVHELPDHSKNEVAAVAPERSDENLSPA